MPTHTSQSYNGVDILPVLVSDGEARWGQWSPWNTDCHEYAEKLPVCDCRHTGKPTCALRTPRDSTE